MQTNLSFGNGRKRLLKDPDIQKRIAEFHQKTELETALKAEGDIKAAIEAEVKCGEVKQFYTKGVETGAPGAFDQLNHEELAEAIVEQTKELAELDPAFAAQLASQQATKH